IFPGCGSYRSFLFHAFRNVVAIRLVKSTFFSKGVFRINTIRSGSEELVEITTFWHRHALHARAVDRTIAVRDPLSGVKFMAKLTPQGSAKAVPVPSAVISTFRLASSFVHAGCGAFCGWSESKRFASGSSAPPGPGIFGVRQTLHSPRVTKYLPRSMEDSFNGALRSHPIAAPIASLRR